MKVRFNLKEETLGFFSKYKRILNHIFSEHSGEDAERALISAGFKYLGAGGFRMAYAFPDDSNYVLKVAFLKEKNHSNMNKREVDPYVQTKYSAILPKMYMSARDYEWIVVEKASQVKRGDLEQIINPKFERSRYIDPIGIVLVEIFTDIRYKMIDEGKDVKTAVSEAEHYRGYDLTPKGHLILDYIMEYDIKPGELRRDNLGTSNGKIVIIDASFRDDIERAIAFY